MLITLDNPNLVSFMLGKITLLAGCLVTSASFTLAPAIRAAVEEWKDTQGESFRGEAIESLGPLALFQTKSGAGRLLAWRFLAPADIVRFHRQAKARPGRADDWALAQSILSQEMVDRVNRVQDGKLVPADLKGRPEPEFFILFYANNAISQSWDLLGHSVEPYNKLQQSHPGMVEGLFFGLQHKAYEHASMATGTNVPWLVTAYSHQNKLTVAIDLAPKDTDAFGIVVATRDGVPVFSALNPTDADLAKVFADLTGLLELLRPGNPHGWQDRADYLRAIQPSAYANGYAEPVLVGNPLVPEGLRKNGVAQVDAQLDVDAGGKVTGVTLNPESNVPPRMAGPLTDALKKACVFVAAVDHGQFVAGHYHYHIEVPH
jgi:hypothetical protein